MHGTMNVKFIILHTYPPMKKEQTESSETSVYKIQTPGNYPVGSIRNSQNGEIIRFVIHIVFIVKIYCTVFSV